MGGWCNTASGELSFIASGKTNSATDYASVVIGGCSNISCGCYSLVLNGMSNQASGIRSTVVGGVVNKAIGSDSTVVGGSINKANGYQSAVFGGCSNTANGNCSTVVGGSSGIAYACYSTVIGGAITGNADCAITAQYSIAIGKNATTTRDYEVAIGSSCAPVTIGGNLTVTGSNTVSDGTNSKTWTNIIKGYTLSAATSSTLGGVKIGSNITNSNGTISITKDNVAAALGYTPPTTDTNTTYDNMSASELSTGTATTARSISAKTISDYVTGKTNDKVSGLSYADGILTVTKGNGTSDTLTIGGGSPCFADGVVLAGCTNTASGCYSSVSGGMENTASGDYSSVSGGACNTASGSSSTVTGGSYNTASGAVSSVSGGHFNEASSANSSVSGGWCNTASGAVSSVSGGYCNIASGDYSLVTGGFSNTASGTGSSVIGGCNSIAYACYSTAIGGTRNYEVTIGSSCAPVKIDGALTVDGANTVTDGTTTKTWSDVLSGGSDGNSVTHLYVGSGTATNVATTNGYTKLTIADDTTVRDSITIRGTGKTSVISDTNGVITINTVINGGVLGGYNSAASGCCSVVSGGHSNRAEGSYSTVSGGCCNTASSEGSSVTGGCGSTAGLYYSYMTSTSSKPLYVSPTRPGINTVAGTIDVSGRTYALTTYTGRFATVSGGSCNLSIGDYASVSGGCWNVASGNYSLVSGGCGNTASGVNSSVSGGCSNTASCYYASVTGGECNTASYYNSTVSGGQSNTASCSSSSVSGGYRNTASGQFSSVNGGTCNIANGYNSTVSGGSDNLASGGASSVTGGRSNIASGSGSSVSGGCCNTASCYYSTISGGLCNIANGKYSSVTGGFFNTACGLNSVVSGGCGNVTSSKFVSFTYILQDWDNPSSGTIDDIDSVLNAIDTGSFTFNGKTYRYDGEYNGSYHFYDDNYIELRVNSQFSQSASISGGMCNYASGEASWAAGGCEGKAYADYSSAIGGGITGNAECATTALGSVAIGKNATTTRDYEIAIGSSCAPVKIDGTLTVDGAKTVTDGTTTKAWTDILNGPDAMTTSELAIGTSTTARTVSAKLLADYVNDRIGASTVATDSTGSTAIGDGSEVTGNNSVSIGNCSEVSSDNGVALGNGASSTEAGAISIGSGSSASGADSTSLGFNADATGGHSVALGDGAAVSAAGSVALGSHSVADAADVISLGHKATDTDSDGNAYGSDLTRRIINVADGVDAHDVVTVGQMNQQLATINNYNTSLDGRIGTLASDGNYIRSSATNDVAANLIVLDTQLKATDIAAIKYDGDDHALATLGGTNGTVLRNVKNGVVNETSMDAVNGSQLHAVKQDILGFADDIRANTNNIRSTNESVSSLLRTITSSDDYFETFTNLKADVSLGNLTDAGKRVLKTYAEDAVATYLAQQGLSVPAAPMAMNTNNSNTLSVTDAGNGSLHVGEGSYVNGTSSIAIGVGNQVNANNSGAFGDPSIINADESYVLGNDNTINTGATGSFIVGNDGVSDAKGGLLFGSNTKATVDAEDAIGLGNRTEVSAKGAIALGSDSIADTENTLSIGNSNMKSKIVNVADGDISQNSSEAVTGAQLFVTNEKVQKNTEALEKKADVDAGNINVSDWATKLGVGKVENGNTDLVTGGTVYDAIQGVKDGNLVQSDGNTITIGANNTASVINVSDSMGQGRKITGVITDVNDASSAANVGYVNAITDNIVKSTNSAIQRVDNKVNKVGANAAAMANLPTPPFDGEEKWAFAAGVGHYQGETAGAVGAFYRPTDNVIARVSGSFGNGDEMVGAGVAVSLNKGNTPAVSKAQMVRTINAQAERIQSLESNRSADREQIERQNAVIANMQQAMVRMQEELAELKAK